MEKALINIKNIRKQFDDHIALENVNLTIHDGEFLTLLGPSGCGKTTLLRILSGFESADSGALLLNGENISDIPPEKRHVNMVFQNYALFPHMSIFDNIAFGLECSKTPKAEIKIRVEEVLEKVQLQHLAHRKPHELSGGQQQRVAIARAVVNNPLVLLLDEPFSALDYQLRCDMRIELKKLQRQLGITFVFVTHDQEEALSMSDRIVVLNHGHIEQIGTPRDIYEEPNSLYVAKFIGKANIFNTTVESVSNGKMQVELVGVPFELNNTRDFKTGDKVDIIIRPEDFQVWGYNEIEHTGSYMEGRISEVIYKGSTVDLALTLDNGKQLAATEFFDEDDEYLEYQIDEKVLVKLKEGWEVALPHED